MTRIRRVSVSVDDVEENMASMIVVHQMDTFGGSWITFFLFESNFIIVLIGIKLFSNTIKFIDDKIIWFLN